MLGTDAVWKVKGRDCYASWLKGRIRSNKEETFFGTWADGWTWWGGICNFKISLLILVETEGVIDIN